MPSHETPPPESAEDHEYSTQQGQIWTTALYEDGLKWGRLGSLLTEEDLRQMLSMYEEAPRASREQV